MLRITNRSRDKFFYDDELEKAKKYFIWDEESIAEYANDAVGQRTEDEIAEEVNDIREFNEELNEATTIIEVAEIFNKYADSVFEGLGELIVEGKITTVYEIVKSNVVYDERDRLKIKGGCTALADDVEPIAKFETLYEAIYELKKYETTLYKEDTFHSGCIYFVEEYHIEENVYDQDGDFVQNNGAWDWTPMEIEVIEKPSYDTLAKFDNLADAEKFANDYDGEDEVFINL